MSFQPADFDHQDAVRPRETVFNCFRFEPNGAHFGRADNCATLSLTIGVRPVSRDKQQFHPRVQAQVFFRCLETPSRNENFISAGAQRKNVACPARGQVWPARPNRRDCAPPTRIFR